MARSNKSAGLLLLILLLVRLDRSFQSFLSAPTAGGVRSTASLPPAGPGTNRPQTAVRDKRWDREIDENSRRKAQTGGMGETAAGAVLGGLLLGPFGALFGASIGSNIGARNAMDRARQEEMERMGLSQDILDMARDIGLALENSNEGLQAVQNSLETQQRFAKRLDADVNDLYERAKAAIANANDELARKLLLERTDLQAKLKKVLISCAEEKGRLKKMEENVAQLQRKAMEVDSLLRRNVSAKTIQNSTDLGLALRSEDPLLQKFRDMGID